MGKGRKCLECEGKGKILITQDGSGDIKNSLEWVQCPTCKGTGDYTE